MVSQKIFKIYDGRTNFWQWDTGQKLIILDSKVTEVRFSNSTMGYSKRRIVYTDNDGLRVCNVPDMLLQTPKNLIAYACVDGDDGSCGTLKAVKFAVIHQPIPSDYINEQEEDVNKVLMRLELLEIFRREIEQGNLEMKKFENMDDAATWAADNEQSGIVVAIETDGKWVPHIIEEDFSLSPICDCDGEMMTLLDSITMFVDAWEGTESPYCQVVTCKGASANSKIDLQPTPKQLAELQEAGISLMAANDNGVVTVYSFDGKPLHDMTMQVAITEVSETRI